MREPAKNTTPPRTATRIPTCRIRLEINPHGFPPSTGFLGLILLFPLLGHATWHSYKDVIDASDWPRNEPMGMP